MSTKSICKIFPVIFGALILGIPCLGQVMIEGGPNGVGLSNRDGKTIVPASMTPSQTIDIRQIQQFAKLERDLGVIKTNKTAWIAIDARRLFGNGQTQLSRSSRALLDKVIAYMMTTGGRGITVTYDFRPGSDSSTMGTYRSNSVVNYMTEKTGLSAGHFCACESIPLKNPTGQSGYGNVSMVNIRFSR